ncbi:MAG: hypothetical protein MUP85_17430 [Candidatus Lokiarchaeota archaeon]|nr:hypothetical protein [Candidatus Lokiarchaeota archaeon]
MLSNKIKLTLFPILGILFLFLGFCLPIIDLWVNAPGYFAFFSRLINYAVLYAPVIIIYSATIIIIRIMKVLKNIDNLRLLNEKLHRWSQIILIFYGLYNIIFWVSMIMELLFPSPGYPLITYGIYFPTVALMLPFIGGLLLLIGYFLNRKFIETEEGNIPKNYKDLEWLKVQYYTLKKSIQEIANDERVSMIEIKNQLKLLDS